MAVGLIGVAVAGKVGDGVTVAVGGMGVGVVVASGLLVPAEPPGLETGGKPLVAIGDRRGLIRVATNVAISNGLIGVAVADWANTGRELANIVPNQAKHSNKNNKKGLTGFIK